MNASDFIYFVWQGFYGHVIIYLKQGLFQGQNILKNPLQYLRNLRFVGFASSLLLVSLASWLLDGIIRQKLKISETYAYSALISAPATAITVLAILYLSERNLADKINWVGALVWAVGLALSMIGGSMLLRR